MKPVYVQQLLKVLLEEYEDIDYMLESLAASGATKRENANIRRLLTKLSQQNDRLLTKFGD